jgi:hypothetical protein
LRPEASRLLGRAQFILRNVFFKKKKDIGQTELSVMMSNMARGERYLINVLVDHGKVACRYDSTVRWSQVVRNRWIKDGFVCKTKDS